MKHISDLSECSLINLYLLVHVLAVFSLLGFFIYLV
jgi:membrane-anchored protein YejM (alkaline phosphatase superfamily)